MDGLPITTGLTIGEWRVDSLSGCVSRGDETVRVDARLMRLLTCLAARAGEVVTTDELLAECWSGVVVTQDSVYQAVASLRRVLGDDSKNPSYIATVPRRGYRMVAAVARGSVGPASAVAAGPAAQAAAGVAVFDLQARWKVAAALAVGAVLCLAQAASVNRGAVAPIRPVAPAWSVADLPFLDLTTQSMEQEYFADGLTEELIDDLSRVPDLKVPSATAAFYFKGKQMTVTNIARELGVAYVVDGSLRKSGSTFRVAARLVRAENGYVVWSGTFDRNSDDVLKVQGDVATEVAKQLQVTLQALTSGARNVQ